MILPSAVDIGDMSEGSIIHRQLVTNLALNSEQRKCIFIVEFLKGNFHLIRQKKNQAILGTSSVKNIGQKHNIA